MKNNRSIAILLSITSICTISDMHARNRTGMGALMGGAMGAGVGGAIGGGRGAGIGAAVGLTTGLVAGAAADKNARRKEQAYYAAQAGAYGPQPGYGAPGMAPTGYPDDLGALRAENNALRQENQALYNDLGFLEERVARLEKENNNLRVKVSKYSAKTNKKTKTEKKSKSKKKNKQTAKKESHNETRSKTKSGSDHP